MPKTDSSPAGPGAVVTDPAQLARLQAVTLEQLALIECTEFENVKRRLVAGLALLCIKASLRHGEFLPWLRRHVAGARQRQCHYLMAAALVFRGAAGAELGALPAAGPADGGGLAFPAGASFRLDGALERFIAGRPWGELLSDLGLKAAGRLVAPRPAASAPARAAAALPEAEARYLGARDEIGRWIEQAEALLLREHRLQHLAGHPDEVRGVVASLRALADQVAAAAKPLLAESAPPAPSAGREPRPVRPKTPPRRPSFHSRKNLPCPRS